MAERPASCGLAAPQFLGRTICNMTARFVKPHHTSNLKLMRYAGNTWPERKFVVLVGYGGCIMLLAAHTASMLYNCLWTTPFR